MGFIYLLAPGLISLIRWIPHLHHQSIVTACEGGRDIKGERSIPASMLSYLRAIHPNICFPVHSPEMEEYLVVSPFRRYGKLALVPQLIIIPHSFLYSREAGFNSERH